MSAETPKESSTQDTTRAPSDSPPEQAEPGERPKWIVNLLAEQASKVDARLGDVGRQQAKQAERFARIEKLLGGGDDGEPDAKPAATTQEDLLAAVRFGEVKANLPEAVQKKLSGMLADGRSFKEVVEYAELIGEVVGQGQSKSDAAPAKTGYGATPPAASAPVFSGSMQDLLTMRDKNPDAFARIISHPDFDMDAVRARR